MKHPKKQCPKYSEFPHTYTLYSTVEKHGIFVYIVTDSIVMQRVRFFRDRFDFKVFKSLILENHKKSVFGPNLIPKKICMYNVHGIIVYSPKLFFANKSF